jgi:hypothetical protein
MSLSSERRGGSVREGGDLGMVFGILKWPLAEGTGGVRSLWLSRIGVLLRLRRFLRIVIRGERVRGRAVQGGGIR